MRFLVPLLLSLAACATPPPAGWIGADVHLVDGTWIGTERECGRGEDETAVECRFVVKEGLDEVPSDLRPTKAVVATLPTAFGTAGGETVVVRAGAGLTTYMAVVIDLADGSRRVVGLGCYLPHAADDFRLVVDIANCEEYGLDRWRDGNPPTPYPPNVKGG
jgi:hypothetical protein